MTRHAFAGAALALLSTSAAFPQITFNFTSFDPPGSLETHALAVNKAGTIVGYYLDSSNYYVGYVRANNGVFSKPIQKSGDNLYATGINDTGVIAGYYYTPSAETSFTLTKGVLTDFAYNGLQTQINKINDNGDLIGIYVESSTSYPGFMYVAATSTTVTFSVTNGAATFAEGLNKNDVIVGDYTTIPFGNYGAFVRSAGGTIETFGFIGASQTFASGINDCNVIVGTFYDSSNFQHGYYGRLNAFTQLDYPGAVQTIVDGINNHGELVGRYIDGSGFSHGFLATPPSPSCTL